MEQFSGWHGPSNVAFLVGAASYLALGLVWWFFRKDYGRSLLLLRLELFAGVYACGIAFLSGRWAYGLIWLGLSTLTLLTSLLVIRTERLRRELQDRIQDQIQAWLARQR